MLSPKAKDDMLAFVAFFIFWIVVGIAGIVGDNLRMERLHDKCMANAGTNVYAQKACDENIQ